MSVRVCHEDELGLCAGGESRVSLLGVYRKKRLKMQSVKLWQRHELSKLQKDQAQTKPSGDIKAVADRK